MTESPYLKAMPHTRSIVANERSLNTLSRAITQSQGQFAIILVGCNDTNLREQVANKLKQECPLQIQELQLSETDTTIFTKVASVLDLIHPQALMVFGLERAIDIDRLLIATNNVRDEFRKHFDFPLVLWVNDQIKQKLIKLAPDYKNWAGVPIQFEVANDKLAESLT
jgi:hypothetical protein